MARPGAIAADDDAADVGGPASLERRPDYALEQSRRALGAVLIALAIGLVANSLLGPIATDAIEYSIPKDGVIESQLIALDIFSLAVVAPLSVALGILTLRGHPLAPVLALGPGLYGAYMFPQYILGPENLDLPGNSEASFPCTSRSSCSAAWSPCSPGMRSTSLGCAISGGASASSAGS